MLVLHYIFQTGTIRNIWRSVRRIGIFMIGLGINHLYAIVLYLRLFAHAEDPDIDEPYKPPVGHVLGKGILCITKFAHKVYFKVPAY